MRDERKVGVLAVGAAIGLALVACTPGSGEGPEATASADGPAGASAPASVAPAIGPEALAEGMRLVGNVPGSDGSFAFWGDLAVVNHWEDSGTASPGDGFVMIDVSDPSHPTQLSRFRCVASYNDISIWDDLVILSQNEATVGDACDATPTKAKDPEAFAGLRVISIADPEHPVPLAAVPTGIAETAAGRFVRGSHTHTLVPDLGAHGWQRQPDLPASSSTPRTGTSGGWGRTPRSSRCRWRIRRRPASSARSTTGPICSATT